MRALAGRRGREAGVIAVVLATHARRVAVKDEAEEVAEARTGATLREV